MSSKKAIISTLLIIQLVFLLLITMTNLQVERQNFSKSFQFKRIAAYKMYALYGDISNDIHNLKEINSTDSTIMSYVQMVNASVPKEYGLEININATHLYIHDRNLEISKEGSI